MILYHGTTLVIPQPRIIRSEQGRDFGSAFYTTDIQQQAERWAFRRARLETRLTRKPAVPIVNLYEWDDSADLRILHFDEPSLEWLDMVVRCRSDVQHTRGYDIVIGKIANDNVGETVNFVQQGIMRREDAVERLRFEKINNQLAFCTDQALHSLRFLRSYQPEGT